MLKINRPNYKFKKCDRVVRVNNPLKHGTVLFRYSRPIKKYSDLMLGPYPELYIVKWDNGKIEKDLFWYGLLQKEKKYAKKKEYYKEHYKMWTWLSENPTKTKNDYFKLNGISLGRRPKKSCYLCQANLDQTEDIVCIECPLYKKIGFRCMSDDSYYFLWLESRLTGNEKRAKEYALLIRDCVKGLF